MKTSYLITILFLPFFAFGQPKGGYFHLNAGPHVTFTSMAGAYVSYTKNSKPGIGYNAQLGYGYKFKSGLWSEVGVGCYNYRQAIDANFLDMHLKPNELSYSGYFLQAMLRVGYSIPVPNSKITVAPQFGLRYMLYVPRQNRFGEWNYVDINLYSYNGDLYIARYSAISAGGSNWTFILHSGIRTNFPVNKRLTFTSTLYFDMGFNSIKSDGFISEQKFRHSEDLTIQATAVNKGDAIGIELGMNYKLWK